MAGGTAACEIGVSPEEVRAALARIVASDGFARSPQLQRLLTFVVSESLSDRGTRLKEYVIAVEVFDRPSTFDSRLDSLVRVEARRVRAALADYYRGEGRDDPIVIDLPKGSYHAAFRRASPDPRPGACAVESHRWKPRVTRKAGLVFGAGAVCLAALAAAALFVRGSEAPSLTERDEVMVTGFSNSTGDSIFDDTLKQGLVMHLEQSPLLNILSERRVEEVIKLMRRSPGDAVTGGLAREVCLRAGSTAVLSGSIDRLGNEYVIGLTATNCSSGDEFAHVQAQASSKETVLEALASAARQMRGKLGESLNSIRNHETPLEDATTVSLEALQAYSAGRQTARNKGSPADIPFYARAVQIDPEFAIAHAALGVSYINLGQTGIGGEHLRRAFELSDRVSGRERHRIAAYYHHVVTGNVDEARATYELWQRSYPRDVPPYINLGLLHLWLGDYEKALAATREALRLEPGNVLAYTNVAALHTKLEHPAQAQAVLDDAIGRGLTSKFLEANLYYLDFLRGDAAALADRVNRAHDVAGGDILLAQHADTEAYRGRLDSARALSRRAADTALRAGAKEAAATWLAIAALRESEFGNGVEARQLVAEALRLSGGRDVAVLAALASARAGDVAKANALAAGVVRAHPENTVLRVYWLPTIRAAVEIAGGRPRRALDELRHLSPFELGSPPPIGLATLYPVYLRGEAFLLSREGAAAAREFQKLRDHPGLVLNFPLRALASLQLARAHALARHRDRAGQDYMEFLETWKDADADVPVLRRARAERPAVRTPSVPFNR